MDSSYETRDKSTHDGTPKYLTSPSTTANDRPATYFLLLALENDTKLRLVGFCTQLISRPPSSTFPPLEFPKWRFSPQSLRASRGNVRLPLVQLMLSLRLWFWKSL
ncbi:uncharacterized protein SPSK_03759 [Sporothrix schenckii 1099-18]|uniref:Uncharacterized protein n=1 Tax=Sporothrix schenckii 1099-18 TaxID=1397361 RepID=A0A0F2LXW0_SPOSC|nr:uncharacterized protein SPSK_03759 [Sporothrix schenckii 1099-18]KJR82307.1 hypothetical protein SPSK_03759 [Sporothrix schenckii 1099-18]